MSDALYKLPKSPGNVGGFQWQALVVGLFFLVAANVCGTQYMAAKFGYQEALGKPIAAVAGVPIYQPLAWLLWEVQYSRLDDPQINPIIRTGMFIVVGMGGGGVFAALWIRYWRTRRLQKGMESLHGSAHWATETEIKTSGLMGSNQGVYVGGWVNPKTKRQEYLRHNGPEHVICYAPTRSGKGVGLVLPTLLAWPHSTVVYDIKGENFALTAGWRGHAEGGNNTVLRFSPVEIDAGIRFNPLNEIRYDTLRDVSDAQTIAQMVCFTGSDEGDHWAESAASLITGLILHIGYVRRQEKRPAASLRDVAAMLNTPGQGIRDTLQQMLLEDHDPTRANKWRGRAGELLTTHPIVSEKAQQMLDKEDKELSGVLSTAATRLSLYADPIVAANTGGSDFKINDLMNSEKPVSLYIVVPPSDKERLRPLVRLMFTLIVNRLTEKMDFKDGRSVQGYKHRLLCMVDEFPSLGKMEVFSEALAFCAGYGIKMYLITQDRTQLVDKYGDNESVTGNCHVRIAYAPNNFQTAEWLSGMTGEQTILKASYSYSGDRMSSIMGQVSANVDEVKRSLLTPDECMRLPGPQKDPKGNVIAPGDMLVFVAGFAPVYGKQILYFLDPVFAKRAKIAAPEYTRTSDEIMPPTLALTSPDLSDDEQAAALHFTDDSDHHGDDLDADPEAEHQPTTEAQA